MTQEEIQAIVETDESVRDSIVRSLGTSTVVLLSISDSREGEVLELCGTATLVTTGNAHYILTAAHVWEKGLKGSREVGITLTEDLRQRFAIDTAAFVVSGPPKPKAWDEWGPDLVFLRVPEARVAGIEASKYFYPLDKKYPKIDVDGIEALVLMGTPKASGKVVTPTYADLIVNGFFAGVEAKSYVREDFDYVDIDAGVLSPGIPEEFNGVSGGGLWRVYVFTSPETAKLDWVWRFDGVAFFQLPTRDNKVMIRCHGLESVRAAIKELPKV